MATKQLPALPEANTAEDNDLLLKRDDSSGSDQKLTIQKLRELAFGDAADEDVSVTATPDTLAKRDSVGRIQAASGGSGNETVVHDDTSTSPNADTVAKRDSSGGIEAAYVNTGQGDNEVYAMDQNVRTTDSVDFSQVSALNIEQDGSQVYSRDNILGTVSESSGVPTGAIIERGSNSNGEFVKYADGTMICQSPSFTASLSGDGSSDTAEFTFPSSFNDSLAGTRPFFIGASNGGSNDFVQAAYSAGTNPANYTYNNSQMTVILCSFGGSGNTNLIVVAYGRWY